MAQAAGDGGARGGPLRRGPQEGVDGGDLVGAGRGLDGVKVHVEASVTVGGRYEWWSCCGSFSTRMAAALNSAVPDFGSTASMVSWLVSTSSGKCRVMKARPGGSPGSSLTGAVTEPRRELTRTSSP